MPKKTNQPDIQISITLPPPLDKPMESFNVDFNGVLGEREMRQMIHELIERQNALTEVVRKLAEKSARITNL